ncbi:MAG: FIST C-terminal domain-containing protein [Polyangiaceae bacterium]|nr:FIST C-terminal domain-containing protein [Polyangiaceae bacterium]
MAARSFCTSTTSSESVARALRETRAAVPSPSAGIVFVAGGAAHVRNVAEQVRSTWQGVPTVIVPGAGVLHERAEIEGTAATAGLLWKQGKAVPFAVGEPADDAEALGENIGRAFGPKATTALVFHHAEAFDPETLEGIAKTSPTTHVFGAGTVSRAGMIITSDGNLIEAPAVGLALSGMARPITATSSACRVISSFEPIEEIAGGLVLRVGNQHALDALSRCSVDKSPDQDPPPVVFAALADPNETTTDGRVRYFIRPIRGIDTTRRGIMIGDDARIGMKMGFALRDATTARTELDTTARFVAQNLLGSAPSFGIYLTCAGRGQNFYGTPDVEVRILRQRFGDLPMAGMHSAFEISPRDNGSPRFELYTSVLALFRTLS